MIAAKVQQIKVIHAEARRIGMDDDTRRLLMVREVGKSSCKDMSEAEAQKVILAMKRVKGSQLNTRTRSQTVTGKYAGILRAMWLNAYNWFWKWGHWSYFSLPITKANGCCKILLCSKILISRFFLLPPFLWWP